MKISGTVLLVFFLVFQSNSAVMGDASAAATEKTIPQAPTVTPTQTLTLGFFSRSSARISHDS